jgi:hypothetical protein
MYCSFIQSSIKNYIKFLAKNGDEVYIKTLYIKRFFKFNLNKMQNLLFFVNIYMIVINNSDNISILI